MKEGWVGERILNFSYSISPAPKIGGGLMSKWVIDLDTQKKKQYLDLDFSLSTVKD